MTKRDLALPPVMVEFFSAYMDPADLLNTQLLETSEDRDTKREATAPTKLDVWVSFVPRLRCFSTHREGIGEIRASSLRELQAKIAELLPEAEIKLHLSKVARSEVAARRRGVPRASGWT
jgi:hypothetical protein